MPAITLDLTNSERLLLLKHITCEIQHAYRDNITTAKWEKLHSLQAKLQGKGGRV